MKPFVRLIAAFLPVLFPLFSLLYPIGSNSQEVPIEARQTAQDYFAKKVDIYSQPQWRQFAVDNMKLENIEQLSTAILGEAITVYKMFSKDAMAASDNPSSLFSNATFIYYEFPIVIDGCSHGVVRVAKRNGAWKAIGGGGKEEIYDSMINVKPSGLSSIVIIDCNIIIAVIRTDDEYYLIPANKNSADNLKIGNACEAVRYRDGIKALRQYSLDKETRVNR